MREDLEYGCKKERFRLKLEDLCYAWALLEEEEKDNLGKVVYVQKKKHHSYWHTPKNT